MKNIKSGVDFLNLVFKDMKDSIKLESTDLPEKNTGYLERLERTHEKDLSVEHKIEILKSYYYDKYIIKSLPESYIKYRKGYFRDLGLADKQELTESDRNLVLNCIKYEQRKSLDNWLSYLFSKENIHPTWFKYYVLHGITKVGMFYSILGDFTKRSASTTAPFIPVEPAIIDKMYLLVSKYLDNEPLTSEEQKITLTGINFRNIYSKLYTRVNAISSSELFYFDEAPEHIGSFVTDDSTNIKKVGKYYANN